MLPSLAAGDTLRYTVTLADYPADVWTLHYRLAPRLLGAAITITAGASGAAHAVTVSAATTAGWVDGPYTCTAWVTNAGGDRHSIDSETGPLTIRPNPATLAAGTDTRSTAEKSLAAVQALLAGKADSGVESYQIAGRQLSSYPLGDLLRLESKLKREIDFERLAAGMQTQYRGGGVRRILIRTC
jgi:hypothetical protein